MQSFVYFCSTFQDIPQVNPMVMNNGPFGSVPQFNPANPMTMTATPFGSVPQFNPANNSTPFQNPPQTIPPSPMDQFLL